MKVKAASFHLVQIVPARIIISVAAQLGEEPIDPGRHGRKLAAGFSSENFPCLSRRLRLHYASSFPYPGDSPMPPRLSKTGSELFIVDNSDKDWKVRRYLHDWADLAHTMDIATGYFEIGGLLALDGQWQRVHSRRFLNT